MGRTDGDRIGADAEKAGVAEADLSGETHEQVEACDRQRKNENERADAIVIGRWKEPRDADKDRGNRDRRQQPCLQQVAQAQTRSILARPNKPWGMAISTIRMIRKATASL